MTSPPTITERPEKILALQFKYFGDAVLLTPALRALRSHFPGSELHLLVPGEIAPLFQRLPCLNRIWPMPRRRGRASFRRSWPILRALRREHFDRSVDFAGNDRGAILSFLIGARQRLGITGEAGFLGRRLCYHQRVSPAPLTQHESLRLAHVLSPWNIAPPASLEPEIHADPAWEESSARLLPARTVLCHLATGQPKKEWPVRHWAAFYQRATAAGWRLAFTTGTGAREKALMDEFKKLAPQAQTLPVVSELSRFLALLKRAEVFISGDTGPLHFAAGLGVPTISLFGPTSPAQWAPIGKRHQILTGSSCTCDGNWSICQNASHCLAAISPEQVFACLQSVLTEPHRP